jgi:two-component system CheB/CheR fusion protein
MSRENEEPSVPCLVVGIGASAGGLEAFTTFFAHVSRDSGMAFLLVQHLSPDHESILPEILSKTAPIRVVVAEQGMRIEPDRVHVIPPDATLTVQDGLLQVVRPAPPRSSRRPVDSLFDSLAKDCGERAVAIVLAGIGSDGSSGLALVKEHGGLTIAQAEFDHHAMDGMPRSAANTGHVDFVLPVEQMAAKLVAYRDHLALVSDRKDGDGLRTDAAAELTAVLATLRSKTGRDFSKYKSKTLTRRIQRRMQVRQSATVKDYLHHLREDPVEPELLFRELLIGVTGFFRDPEHFQRLSTALAALLERAGESLRIWVAACSTGEEVYSIAITVRELLNERSVVRDVQIFGTDIDDQAVEFARAGRFQRVEGLTPEQLQRWFIEEEGAYLPAPQIRGMCVFSVHDLVRDPPFSKLDLVSCRNLLIYMGRELQDRLLRLFHYALKPDGVLFLGSSEGVSGHEKLFASIDKAAHIFRRNAGDAAFPALPIPPPTPLASHRPNMERVRGGGDQVDRSVRAALAKYSPVFFVVDRQSNIVRYSGGEAARYLEPAEGIASLGLQSNLRKSLRTVVRAALQTVMKTGEGTVVDDVPLVLDAQHRTVSVIVEPVQDTADEVLFVVAFQELRKRGAGRMPPYEAGEPPPDAAATEQELRKTRAQLHATIAELETANEEMKSAAEEYQSVNEELQSANEELQTSKEEMQSINEELQTVNAEMLAKNDLLSNLNSDLQNLLNSTQIATIFLDENLRIRNFTPGMANIFSVRDSDRGRPLTEIVSLLAYDELRRDVEKVLRELTLLERELELLDRGAAFLMRIRPYLTARRSIDGVVITFVDITERKRAERARRASERRFTAIVNQAPVGIVETDRKGEFVLTNAVFEKMAARTAAELQRLRRQDLIDPRDVDGVMTRFEQAMSDGEPFEIEYRLLRADGSNVWVHDSVSILPGVDGQELRIVSVTLDVEARKRTEEQTGLLLSELDHRVKNILAIVSSIVVQSLKASPSPEIFAESVQGRITAITRAHSLLTNRAVPGSGTLRHLITTELEPYRGRALRIEGPDLVLTPKAGLSIAMAIHELASNAVKYGSLSTTNGGLSVTWSLTEPPGRRLRLAWAEDGGPRVAGPPARRGFGTTLIERSLAYEWNAKVDREFAVDGLICIIDLPFTSDVGDLDQTGRASQ